MGKPNHNEVDFYDVCTNFSHDLPLYEKIFIKKNLPLLELAAGTGRVAIALAEKGHKIIAMDISEKMLIKA